MDTSLRAHMRLKTILGKEKQIIELRSHEKIVQLQQIHEFRMQKLNTFAKTGQLTYELFHDLSNLITLISLNLDNVQKADHHLKYVKTQANLLSKYLNETLEQIQHKGTREKFLPRAQITQTIKGFKKRAAQKNINISFTADKRVYFYGDSTKFNRVITNLICNALDSFEGAPILVRIPKTKTIKINLKQGSTTKIIVQDNGKGINPKNLEKIFAPLFTTKKAGKGTGLGLAICKKIVQDNLGGKIRVKSVLGNGTTFIVEIPRKNT